MTLLNKYLSKYEQEWVENPNFEDGSRVHNWRNYIPEYIESIWESLSVEARQTFILMAQAIASAEDWEWEKKMEKKIKELPVYKNVLVGRENVEVYISFDGKEFSGKDAEKYCLQWEQEQREEEEFSKIAHVFPSLYFSGSTLPDEFYLAQTEKELELIKEKLGWYQKKVYVYLNGIDPTDNNFVDFKVGDCIGVYQEDGGDHRPDYHFYTLEYIRNLFKEFLRETER